MTIFEIDPRTSHLDTVHYLSFFYYAGIVYMARNKFAKAIESFEYAITVPSDVCSAISTEAYKKAMLVSLLESGSPYSCPKYTAPVVKRRWKNKCKEYTQVAEIYAKCDRDKMKALLQKEAVKAGFITDGNWGLVKQLYASLQSKAMQNLTSTYIKLSLQDIAQKVGAPSIAQAETDLVKLIADGVIEASIDQASGMVSFGGGGASRAGDSGTDVSEVQEAIRESMELAEKLRVIKTNVLTSTSYVKSISQASSGGLHSLGGRMGGGLVDLGDISMIDDDMDME